MPDVSLFDRHAFSRRRFLQGTALTAGVATLSPYLSKLEAFAAPPVADNQGILLTIYLGGGNDGLNMVSPVTDPAYATLRPNLKIMNGYSVGEGLALHPAMVKMKARFDAGNVAIVRGVGYQPPDLSHFSSNDIWTHGWGGNGTPSTGWLGRYLDQLPNAEHESLYGVALHGGVNAHLAGAVSHASSLPLNIGDAFGIDRSDASDARMYDELIRMGSSASGLGDLGDLYATSEMELLQLAQRIRTAYDFPDQATDISSQMVLAANLINANLGIRVIDTELDGFDTHSDQLGEHATLLSKLDTAIEAFYLMLDPRWRSQVTIMTFSEFGRRPEETGDGGTDHGTAAPLFVIGDHVNGGLHGAQPSLTALDDNDNLVPSVDFRSVYATVLHEWLKADAPSVLGKSFPELALFESAPAAPFTGTEAGYWLAAPGGGVRAFGLGTNFGAPPHATHPVVGGAATPSHRGLWLTGSDGHIVTFGDAKSYGSTANRHLGKPIVGMAATPSGKGYWLVTASGGIFPFGDARSHGSTAARLLSKPVVGMAATPSGKGYWLVTSGGGVHAFGDAKPLGSVTKPLAKPIVDIASTRTGKGYWLVTAGGGVFAFGDAKPHGGSLSTHAPVVTVSCSQTGNGYWLAAADGTVGAFGDAPKLGRIKAPTAVLVRC